MARYVSEVTLNRPIDVVSMVMEDYTYHEKYKRADWNGEMVFMKEESYGGNRYLLWYYAAGVLHMEAWKKGTFGGEAGPGPVVIAELNGLVAKIRHQDETKIAGGHIGSDPLHHDSNHRSNHENLRQDTVWQGNPPVSQPVTQRTAGQEAMGSAFVLLVLSFCTMGLLPILSIIFAVAAKKKCRGKEMAGFALCSAVATFVIIVSIIMMMSYTIPLFSSGFMNLVFDYIRQYF